MSKETVTVTVELPGKAKELLEEFAKKTDTTVEAMFLMCIQDVLSSFYNGEFYKIWTKEARDLAKEIEKQFDC